jgi:hypothetical protein
MNPLQNKGEWRWTDLRFHSEIVADNNTKLKPW